MLEPLFNKVVGIHLQNKTVAATSGFSRQQFSFSAKSDMYWRQSHWFLSRTHLKTGVKFQKQSL